MASLRKLKRSMQRAARDTCAHERRHVRFTAPSWSTQELGDADQVRAAVCNACGTRLIARRPTPMPVTEAFSPFAQLDYPRARPATAQEPQ